jgi:hypothetical protein
MPKRRLTERTNRVGAQFLQIDSEVALTFSGMALRTSDEKKKRRTTQVARRAYDTIMRLRKNIALGDTEGDKLEANLQRLRSELQVLGQRV